MFKLSGQRKLFQTSARHDNVCPWHYHATLSQPNSFPAHIFDVKQSPKSSRDKAVEQQEIKVLLCFVVESWSGKGQNVNFFICPPANLLLYQLQTK